MPNHVTNRITIKGKAKDVKTFIEDVKSDENDFDFKKIKPMPSNIFRWNLWQAEKEKYGKNNWYDWWTKWNSYEVYNDCNEKELDEWDKYIECEIFFQTAWSTPEPIFNEIYNKYIVWMGLDLEFEIEFADEDIGSNYGYVSISKNWFDLQYEHLDDKEWPQFACEILWIDYGEYLSWQED